MNKPDFIIVGAARSGTTSLHEYLSQHPKLCGSRIKEPKYFTNDLYISLGGPGDNAILDKIVRDEKTYSRLWDSCKDSALKYESSSDYLYHYKSAIPKIINDTGDIPIIICLRSPVERSFSAYQNLVRDNREKLDFKNALLEEKRRIEMSYDWMWHYTHGSMYYEQVKAYMTNFTKVKVILFEEFVESPIDELKGVLDFLGLSQDFSFNVSTRFSQSGVPKNYIIKRLSSRVGVLSPLRNYITRNVPRKWLQAISRNWFKKQRIGDIHENLGIFTREIYELERLLDKDLSLWRK